MQVVSDIAEHFGSSVMAAASKFRDVARLVGEAEMSRILDHM